MHNLKKVLIVGGGIAGMSAALRLSELGANVDLIEADPTWCVYGAGITLTGASLRAFQALGVLDAIREQGYIGAGVRLCHANGNVLGENPPASEAIVHAGGGIMRPALHQILAVATREAGVNVKLGVTVDTLEHRAAGAEVSLSDGMHGSYDLIIGADGIHSRLRRFVRSDSPAPERTGQGCWRVAVSRPAQVDKATIVVGGPSPLGLIPVSSTQMYLFLLEHAPTQPRVSPQDQLEYVRSLLSGYGGVLTRVRESLGSETPIVYRPLEWILVAPPWHHRRLLLIGDAAHATTPHLAVGAGLAVEDALVLTEELSRSTSIDLALEAHSQRRYARCAPIVRTAVEIGALQMQQAAPDFIQQRLRAVAATLEADY